MGSDKEWEPHIYNFVKLYNTYIKIKNIIDIGANFGYHTLLFSHNCEMNVYAFEPQLQNFQLLEDNIKINNIKNVVVYNYACGEDNCEIKMPIFDKQLAYNMGDITPNVDVQNNYSITKSFRLDDIDFKFKIDLIKIDVQGWEKWF